jgi:hypothetical protein
VWQAALIQWRKTRTLDSPDDQFLYTEILVNLAKVEEEEKDFAKALEHLEALRAASGNRKSVQKWIADLKQRQAAAR